MFLHPKTDSSPKLMLSFSISEANDVKEWSYNLSRILETHSLEAIVFFTGDVAEQNPQCVKIFGENIDIGSQTYSNLDLTSISDYSKILEDVRKGKLAVEVAGNLNTKSFRAPFGATDQNIYSLLSRNEIIADFSYENQYNIFQNGQFIKIEIESYVWPEIPSDLLANELRYSKPIIIFFDNGINISEIEKFVNQLENTYLEIVSASELVGKELTIRGAP
jgi:peptidoglycan/xylan/chitin deacetylase (PgdA/CDA1 family)